jgi:hypothetical protein
MMVLTIRQKADRIGGFRFVSVFLMETLARWVPATPELEAKVLFGRHVWVFAQHADQLGRRTGELRAPAQYSHAPTPQYLQALQALPAAESTLERVAGIYDVVLPDLERRYRAHMAAVDPIDDEPSVRIIERILADFPRLVREREAFARERSDLAWVDPGWPQRLAALAAAAPVLVAERDAQVAEATPA